LVGSLVCSFLWLDPSGVYFGFQFAVLSYPHLLSSEESSQGNSSLVSLIHFLCRSLQSFADRLEAAFFPSTSSDSFGSFVQVEKVLGAAVLLSSNSNCEFEECIYFLLLGVTALRLLFAFVGLNSLRMRRL